ncbi:hypothetical protein A4X09_0g3402 [Tilletia walkeri]|uniref:Uncharacterized protein n=1 Tax=Tilletia walkeri TaxID=117179 RepID=A0A8X7N9M4_9BASI|nr:hypothetical protein A4X09_0g3402 [Tilletia walkeri]
MFGSSSAPSGHDSGSTGSAVWFQPDDTFRSFCALLEAPAVSHAHIALIGPEALTASVATYTGALHYDHVAEFVKLIANSPCLWASIHPDAVRAGQAQRQTLDSGAPALPSLRDRTDQIIQAIGQSVKQRIILSMRARQNSTGWQTRRIVSHWVSTMLSNSQNDVSELADAQDLDTPFELQSLKGMPIARLAICTGLLAGLQGAQALWEEQGRLGLDVRHHVKLAEIGWVAAFEACLEIIDALKLEDQHSAAVMPLHCAVQVMPFINSRRLEILSGDILLRIVADRLLLPIERSQLLASLRQDVKKGSDGKLVLELSSATAQRLYTVQNDDAFRTIAPLSRILSGALARLARKLSPADLNVRLFGVVTETKEGTSAVSTTTVSSVAPKEALEPLSAPPTLLRRLHVFSRTLESDWWSSELAKCAEGDLAEATKPIAKELWTVFKTILFSFTMIFDSLVDAVVDMCPSPTITIPAPSSSLSSSSNISPTDSRWGPASTSNIPAAYLQCMHAILLIYAHMYWITSTFGHDGFDVYRSVFYSALDVIGRDGEACVGVMEAMVAHLGFGAEDKSDVQVKSATYFMLVSEQILGVLPDKMLKGLVLKVCKPWLADKVNKDAFESAHSVVLSMYTNNKDASEDLTPFYIDLLLSTFPSDLSAGQFEHAVTTVISAIADRDDSLVWWVMELLASAIEREPIERKGEGDATSSSSRRLELQLVYTAQISTVNLVLLRTVMDQVRRYVLEYPITPISLVGRLPGFENEEGDKASTGTSAAEDKSLPSAATTSPPVTAASARQRLCEKAFDALTGLDASTREEGVRWWLDNRTAFGV